MTDKQPPQATQTAARASETFDLYAPIPGMNPLLGAVLGPDGRPRLPRQAEMAYSLAIGSDPYTPDGA